MKKIFFFISSMICYTVIHSQNVGIGTATPNTSAQLEISSSSKGFLMPRMTSVQRDAIASPAVGLQIFNLDDQCTDIYDGANWIKNCGVKQKIDSATLPGNFWVRKKDVPLGDTTVYYATSFSTDTYGYVCAGFSSPATASFQNKALWQYNPPSDTWTRKGDYPGAGDHQCTGFSIGAKLYMGTGQTLGNGPEQKDFWEYNTTTNTWTRKADFGGAKRMGAIGFSIGSNGYFGFGNLYGSISGFTDFWEYNPQVNAWSQKKDVGSPGLNVLFGIASGLKGYILKDRGEFWSFNPGLSGTLGTWIRMADFPGSSLNSIRGFTIGSKIYLTTEENYQGNFWEYDTGSNTWTRKADFPILIRGLCGFSVGNKGYAAFGEALLGAPQRTTWEFNPLPATVPAYAPNAQPFYASISDGAWTKLGNNVYNSASSGYVGIGTSNPTTSLDIVGKLKIADGSQGVNKILTSDVNGLASWQNIPGVTVNWSAGSNNNIYNANAGNVGINNNNPNTARLVIGGSAGAEGLDLSSADQYANLRVIRNSYSLIDKDLYLGLGSGVQSSLHLYSNNGETITLKGGNAGIGTISPSAKLHVSSGSLLVDGGQSTHAQGAYIEWNKDNGTGISYFLNQKGLGGGGIIIGEVDAANNVKQNLIIEYNGNATLAGALTQNSDARLKTNIQPLTSTLQNLQQLTGYTYNWKDKARDNDLQIGLLAQELQKVYPQLVKTAADGTLSVNYSGLVPVLIEGMKEQEKKIETQQQQINELKVLVKKLVNK